MQETTASVVRGTGERATAERRKNVDAAVALKKRPSDSRNKTFAQRAVGQRSVVRLCIVCNVC